MDAATHCTVNGDEVIRRMKIDVDSGRNYVSIDMGRDKNVGHTYDL